MKAAMIILIIAGLLLVGCGVVAATLYIARTSGDALPLPKIDGDGDSGLLATPTPATAPPVLPTATAQPTLPPGAGGFQGTFAGTLAGDNNSSAPVTLELSQSGATVNGTIRLGQGLTIDGGNCGAQAIPAGDHTAVGQVDPANPNHLDAAAQFVAQGFTIGIDMNADLTAAADGLTTQITLDLPLLCGRDPVITGTLARN